MVHKEKVAAIVPAFNEAKNVGAVLNTLLKSPQLDEVILVDDGSSDGTAQIGKKLGARVLRLPANQGKARAMLAGANATKADVLMFFDADLLGLKEEHITFLLMPLLAKKAVMSVGVRDRWGGLPRLLTLFFPVSFSIGGERAMRPEIIKSIPEKFVQNLSEEISLNYYCKVNHLPVSFVDLKGLNVIIKEKKWGWKNGLIARWNMIKEIVSVRVLIFAHKKEFIKNTKIA